MSPISRRRLLILLFAVAFTRAVSIYSFYLYDDAFITFRFAANLSGGAGFVYNIGERVQGISTPLWGLLLTAFKESGIPLELASRWLALIFDLVTAYLVIRWLSRAQLTAVAMWFAFFFALDPFIAKTATGGMESSLFLLLTVAAAQLALQNRMTLAACLSAASVFVRPEGLLFAACLLLFAWHRTRSFPWRAVLLGLCIIAIGVAWQTLYYGDLIPQSVRAKMALARTYDGIIKLVIVPLRDPVQILLTVLTLAGLATAWRRSAFVRLYGLWAGALFVVWLITGAHLWSWYCVPVWFFKALVAGFAMQIIIERYPFLFNRVRALLQPLALLAIVVVSWTGLAIIRGPDRIEANIHSKLRAWAAQRDIRGQTAYGMDFGAFGYYTGARILDEAGLVYPLALDVYKSDLKAMLLAERPEWAFVTNYMDNPRLMRTPELAELYEPVWRASVQGDTILDFPIEQVPRRWTHDFTLYRSKVAALSP